MAEFTIKLFLSLPETADALGVGLTTVKKLVRTGEIPSVKIGDRRLVPVEGATAYAASLVRKAA